MSNFFRKRDDNEPDPQATAYLPTQPVDYTSLPVVEEKSALDKFRALPLIRRILILLLLFAFLGAVGFALSQVLGRPETVVAPPAPQLTIEEARVLNGDEIRLTGNVVNSTPGLTLSAVLLQGSEAIAWIDSATSTISLTNGAFDTRVRRDANWQERLDAAAPYVIELSNPAIPPQTMTVTVPPRAADDFYKGGEVAVAATATTAPTAVPPTAAPAPTDAPAPPLAAAVVASPGATLIFSPTLGSRVLLTLDPNTPVEPLLRTDDSRFFLVEQGNTIGWLPAEQAQVDLVRASQVRSVIPPAGASSAGPLTAVVANGGNIRYAPNVQSGTVLGQMIAGQTVTLQQKLASGTWYYVIAPAAQGWVARDLLQIDQRTIAAVPLAR